MTITTTEPVEVDRCDNEHCHEQDPEYVSAYECSRCGRTFSSEGGEIEGPPFRCPDDNIFLGRTEDVCSQCEEPSEIETVTLHRCPACGDLFDEPNEDHLCSTEEREAAAAEKRARSDAHTARLMAEFRRERERKDRDGVHAAAILRSAGFRVHLNTSDGYDDLSPDDHQDGDIRIYTDSSGFSIETKTFLRMVTELGAAYHTPPKAVALTDYEIDSLFGALALWDAEQEDDIEFGRLDRETSNRMRALHRVAAKLREVS